MIPTIGLAKKYRMGNTERRTPANSIDENILIQFEFNLNFLIVKREYNCKV